MTQAQAARKPRQKKQITAKAKAHLAKQAAQVKAQMRQKAPQASQNGKPPPQAGMIQLVQDGGHIIFTFVPQGEQVTVQKHLDYTLQMEKVLSRDKAAQLYKKLRTEHYLLVGKEIDLVAYVE